MERRVPQVFRDLKDLVRAMEATHRRSGIMGIDGWTGVGKTTLAQQLATSLGASFYDLDSALTRDQQSYLSALRLSEISGALANTAGAIVVSGICLRHILKRVERRADTNIYLKRMAVWGWADEDEIVVRASCECPVSGADRLRQEMREYHSAFAPHRNADYEFHRFE